MNEAMMRAALGLTERSTPRKRATVENPNASKGILVTLSVRGKHGGLPKPFEFLSKSISRLAAEVDAKKAARAKGWTVWAVLEVAQA
ncbi:hypothetical protein [Pseudomonas parasichuanensis]|uniref:hypothetical protein n=1 Tax=Pseudomonas parasichuanensis TaxID=2892329 RepID=UPI001F1E8007|nr:hypothetical protein [Pseudomonas parasichuanensis]